MEHVVSGAARHRGRGRRGALSQEAIIGAALVTVIAVSIVLTVLGWRSSPDDPASERANRPMAFQCEPCGHKFEMAPTDFHAQWKDVDLSKQPPGSQHKAHCPKCRKRFCAKMLADSRTEQVRTVPGPTRP